MRKFNIALSASELDRLIDATERMANWYANDRHPDRMAGVYSMECVGILRQLRKVRREMLIGPILGSPAIVEAESLVT